MAQWPTETRLQQHQGRAHKSQDVQRGVSAKTRKPSSLKHWSPCEGTRHSSWQCSQGTSAEHLRPPLPAPHTCAGTSTGLITPGCSLCAEQGRLWGSSPAFALASPLSPSCIPSGGDRPHAKCRQLLPSASAQLQQPGPNFQGFFSLWMQAMQKTTC